jgi:molecular chaperone DnaK (HSP70)
MKGDRHMEGWGIAIDLGATCSSAAVALDDGPSMLEVDGERRIPSTVLLAEDGSLVVGAAAAEQATLRLDRVERAPKRYLGKPNLLLGGTQVDVSEAVGELLALFVREGERQRGGQAPSWLMLTHPTRWSAVRLEALRAAGAHATTAEISLIDEPSAAAFHFLNGHSKPAGPVGVYDLGGETFDVAVLQSKDGMYEVLGAPGGDERLGGEDFDHRIYEFLKEYVADEDQDVGRHLSEDDDPRWGRARTELLHRARRAKEALSRYARTSVFVAPLDREIVLTRTQFDKMIAVDIERTVDEFERTVTEAGLEHSELTAIYLVGGSSRIPLIQQQMMQRFGDRITTWNDPKYVVALGAVRAFLQQRVDPRPADMAQSPDSPAMQPRFKYDPDANPFFRPVADDRSHGRTSERSNP